jgi:hypothetical protein
MGSLVDIEKLELICTPNVSSRRKICIAVRREIPKETE